MEIKLRRTQRALVLLVVAMFALLGLTVPAQATTPKQVLVLGDSIVGGASNYIGFYIGHDGKAQANIKAIGGTAICDVLKGNGGPWTIDGLLAAKRYDAVVMAFSGNSMTKCMGGRTGQAVVDKYRADANQIMNITRFFGVPKTVWVQPPAAQSADLNYIRTGVGAVYASLPLSWPNARVIDGGTGVEAYGQFAYSLNCESWEKTAEQGCVNNMIRIGDNDGVHFFCARRGPSYYGIVPPCDVYSAGSNRYGMNLSLTRSFIGI